MAERADVRVEGSLSRCPWCRDDLVELRDVVACAACGARHHDECHREHGRCAACGATARLVFDPASHAPPATRAPWAPPPRDITRPFGWFLVVAAGVLTFAAIMAQLDEPRTGTFLLVLALAGAFGGTGVRCLRWRPPGALDPKKAAGT